MSRLLCFLYCFALINIGQGKCIFAQNSSVIFSNSPTSLEVVDNSFNVLSPTYTDGLFTVTSSVNTSFEMYMDSIQSTTGSQISMPVYVNSFTDITSMQGSITFDASVISYLNISNFNLPGLSSFNFGTTQTGQGILTYSWYDASLQGVSVTDSTLLFSIDFTVTGTSGQNSSVSFSDTITINEIVNNSFTTISCNYTNGFVQIPSIYSNVIVTNPICNGGYGSVTIGMSGGIPPYVYSLNGLDTSSILAGTYTIYVSDQSGQIIPVSFQLTNPPVISISQNIIICSNDFYNIGSNSYNTIGNYTDTLISSLGCDLIVYTNLNILSISQSTSLVTECDSYFWNGVTYTTSGTYDTTLMNVLGCDSVTTLVLTIINSTVSSATVTECDSYFWNGVTYTTSGVYDTTLINAVGCDSTAILNLTINNSTSSTSTITACDAYLWNGTTYTTSGLYFVAGTNGLGCADTSWLNLTISYNLVINNNDTICEGDTLTIGSISYTVAGNYNDTLLTSSGCDSIINTTLTTNIAPQSQFITGNDSVYLNSTHPYTVNPINTASTYNWGIIGAASIINGQGTELIDVDWTILGGQYLYFIETTIDGCVGDTVFLQVKVVNEPSAITDVSISKIKIYPNPSKGLFNIQFTNNTIQKLNIRILNSIGQVIFEDIQNGFIGNYKNTVNFSSFSKSIYFLEIQTDQGKINKKLILN